MTRWIVGMAVVAAAWGQGVEKLEERWRVASVVTIGADLHHVQGIAIEGKALWVSSVDAKAKKGFLTRVELPSGRVVQQVEVQEGARIHPGGIALDGDSIWMPVAEYHRGGPTTVERRDKVTLARKGHFEVGDHIGCIAAGKGFLVGGVGGAGLFISGRRTGGRCGRRRIRAGRSGRI